MFEDQDLLDIVNSDEEEAPLTREISGPKLYDNSPGRDYKIQIIEGNGQKHRFKYFLAEGKELPHETTLRGMLTLESHEQLCISFVGLEQKDDKCQNLRWANN